MDRTLKISGENAKLHIALDDQEPYEFDSGKSISAEQIYEILDFHKGDTYIIEQVGNGELPEGAYSAICELMQNIVDRINDLSIAESTEQNQVNAEQQ